MTGRPIKATLCLLLLSACHSQTTEEEIAVARQCDVRDQHVVITEDTFGLERAQCVPPSQGVSPGEFIAEFQRLGH